MHGLRPLLLSEDPFLAERHTRCAQNAVSLRTSRFESGGRDHFVESCGRGEKGRRGPKTLSVGSAEKATQVIERRYMVADAPNGWLYRSLGKRVSKSTISPSNDRSSANCRFESCRPHHFPG